MLFHVTLSYCGLQTLQTNKKSVLQLYIFNQSTTTKSIHIININNRNMPSSNNNNNSNNSAETALSPSEFRAFTLEKKEQIGDHIWCFQFAFPQHAAHLPSGLKTGEYICVRATIRDKPIIRYYSPISTPHDKGHISLMIKIDSSGGEMSWFLRDMKLGDTLEFKGPMGGHQYNPEKYKKYGLIAGWVVLQICAGLCAFH